MDEAPKTFGRYEVLRALGSGGMGEIYLARQRGIAGVDRLVVLKTILPHLAREPGFIERFLDEMRLSMLLTHGNIVQVYDVGEEGGRYYMAMEWVDGLDLREILARLDRAGRPMPEEVAVYVLVEVAKGLAYAHARCDPSGRPLAIVHRDVSPANILVANDGQVKVTDFGVAVATARLSFSVPGTLHGKVAYMSPEQVTGADLDGRSDQFSLGVVAYEMLCGERPFDGDSDVAILEQVRRCEPRPLWEAAPWLDAALARVVMRALARDPSDRFPTMEDFAQALTDCLFAERKVVSAKNVAEFMATLRGGESGPVEGGGPGLDEAARRLLPAGRGGPEGGVTVEARATEVAPVRPAPEEGRFTAWNVVAAVALLVGLAGGMWAVGRLFAGAGGQGPEDAWTEEAGAGPMMAASHDLDGDNDPRGEAASSDGEAAQGGAGGPGLEPSREGERREAASEFRMAVRVRSVPEGAAVFQGGRRLGVTPLVVNSARVTRLTVRLEGHEEALLTVGPDSPGTVEVRLTPLPMGRVRFRFFPADALVFLDDQAVQPRGNVVDKALPVGEHVLTLRSREEGGAVRTVRFEVRPDQVVELGTVELPVGP